MMPHDAMPRTMAIVVVVAISFIYLPAGAAGLISVSPTQNQQNVSPSTSIAVTFDESLDESTVGPETFFVYGNYSGWTQGAFTVGNSGHTIEFDPAVDFYSGEVVTVVLTQGLATISGPVSRPYIWTFTIAAQRGLGHILRKADYPLAYGAYSVYIADLDDDGDLDLAACGGPSGLTIYVNDGDGNFTESSSYDTGNMPRSVVAADFNRDGVMDLATANWNGNSVSVFLNNGDGTFSLQSLLATGTTPAAVVASDFNGDGYLDVATTNWNSKDISIMLNDGDGQFSTTTSVSCGDGVVPRGLFTADMDNDWDMDLIFTDQSGGFVGIFANEFPSKLAVTETYPTSDHPLAVYATDLDENGINDLVVACYSGDAADVFLRGDGWVKDTSYAVQQHPKAITVSDIDGDRDLDLVTADYQSNAVSVFLNSGGAQFAPEMRYSTGSSPNWVASGDLDGDGDMDLMTANFGNNSATALRPRPLIMILYMVPESSVYALVEDTLGRRLGYDEFGVYYEEIPTGSYYRLGSRDSIVVLEPGEGTYTFSFYSALKSPASVYSAIIKIDGTLEAVAAEDNTVGDKREPFTYVYQVEEGFHYLNGDANDDGVINISDPVLLTLYIFKGDTRVTASYASDANCDQIINIGDAVYLVNYIFKNGNKPCCCNLCGDDCL